VSPIAGAETRSPWTDQPRVYFARMALTPGTGIGPCEVLTKLGAGGMGEIYPA